MDIQTPGSVALPSGVVVTVSNTPEAWWTEPDGAGYVHPSNLAPDPQQPRRRINADRLAELCGSIATTGVRESITVTPISRAPYRSAVGIAQMGVAGAALLCNQGIIDIPVLYNAGYLDIGLGVLSGGLLAEDVWDRYLPRMSLCNPLHYHEAYIGLGTMATGVIGLF